MPDDSDTPTAHTKHGDLTLDQVAEQLAGMSRLMAEVSDRYWILYYAAKGGNWTLARHELAETRKTLRMACIVRPKYLEALETFDVEMLKPIDQAIRVKDFDAFDAAYQRATNDANEKHVELGYSYIEWRLPDTPPGHLRLDSD